MAHFEVAARPIDTDPTPLPFVSMIRRKTIAYSLLMFLLTQCRTRLFITLESKNDDCEEFLTPESQRSLG